MTIYLAITTYVPGSEAMRRFVRLKPSELALMPVAGDRLDLDETKGHVTRRTVGAGAVTLHVEEHIGAVP